MTQAITVSLPRMAGNKIAYDILQGAKIVGRISQLSEFANHTMGGSHFAAIGESTHTGSYRSCVEWAEKTFQNPLTGSQPLAILDTATQAVEDSQMTTQAPKVQQSPIFLAAQESATLDIIENLLLDLPHDTSLTDDLILTIQAYIASEGLDGNKSHDELGQLARKAKLWGIFKLCGQVKNSPEFLDLVAKYEPTLMVSGGNQMGTITEVAGTPVEPKPAKAAKGSKKEKTPTKTKEKAPKVAKVKKEKSLLPLPTIADVAALEALDRKGLMASMKALNEHQVTGVKANGTSKDIQVALAKHLLNVDYIPTTKPSKGSKAAKAPEIVLDMPVDLTWQEVLNMKYRQLQGLMKIFRSHKLFEGSIGGAGVTKEFLLSAAKNVMISLGHDIQPLQVSKQNPDNAKPTLEKAGVKYDLMCQATELLAA